MKLPELKKIAQITDIISEKVELKKQGNNFKGLCPFHKEKTPSFTVFPKTQTYKCFGCGQQGDVFDFIKEHENVTFPEAKKLIAEKYNIEIPEYKSNDVSEDLEYSKKQEILICNDLAKEFYKNNLSKCENTFLHNKGLTDETIDKFQIGYSSKDFPLHQQIESAEYSFDIFECAGLLKKSKDSGKTFDYFWGRGTIFPIHDDDGRVIGFAMRSENNEIKYLNSPETLTYKKSQTLYGFYLSKKSIRENDEVILVEGYTDVMAMHQSGLTNTVGVCGTSFTKSQVEKLLKLTKNITIMFDGDEAGMKAMEKATTLCLENGANVRCIILPENTDPCDLLLNDEVEIPSYVNSQKQDAILCICNQKFKNAISPIERANALKEIAPILAKISDLALSGIYLSDISTEFKTGKIALRRLVESAKEKINVNPKDVGEFIAAGINKIEHIKIRDTYFEKYVAYDKEFDSYSVTWVTRKASELKRERGEKYLNEIPRFNGLTVEPEHFNFKFIHSYQHNGRVYKNANFYHQIPHIPQPIPLIDNWDSCKEYDISNFPKIKNTLTYIHHVFGGDWMKALDYFSILYRFPKRPLPALCLVSRQKGTGKSTLINLMRAIFGENVTKSSAKRLASNFNKFMLGKLLVGIEETNDEKGSIQEELKDMITGREMVIEGKGKDSFTVKSFVKFIFCSNYPETFLKGGDDDRLIVIDVPMIPEGKADNDLLKKMVKEIPHFLFFLKNRKIRTPDKGRLWFKRWETPALLRLQEASQPRTLKYVQNLINELFLKCKFAKTRGTNDYQRNIKLSSRALANYLNRHVGTNMFKGYSLTQTLTTQGLVQSTYSTKFNYPNVDVESIGEWQYEWVKDSAKYYSFDIIDYLSPEEIRQNYSSDEIEELFSPDEIEKFGLFKNTHSSALSDEDVPF